MNEADERIGTDFSAFVFELRCIQRVASAVTGVLGIGEPVRRFGGDDLVAQSADLGGFGTVFRPQWQVAMTQKILVIEQQFFQARAGHVGEFQLRFAAHSASAIAFRDVLPAAAGCLHHLVMRAAAPVDEAFAEMVRAVVDERGGLKAPQLPVTAAGAQTAVLRRRRIHAPVLANAQLSDKIRLISLISLIRPISISQSTAPYRPSC